MVILLVVLLDGLLVLVTLIPLIQFLKQQTEHLHSLRQYQQIKEESIYVLLQYLIGLLVLLLSRVVELLEPQYELMEHILFDSYLPTQTLSLLPLQILHVLQ